MSIYRPQRCLGSIVTLYGSVFYGAHSNDLYGRICDVAGSGEMAMNLNKVAIRVNRCEHLQLVLI